MTTHEAPPTDHVEAFVTELADGLHGPVRAKRRLLAEIRDGLAETVDAHTEAGDTDRTEGFRRAVREFGSPRELRPVCQRELTVAQARHTARALASTAPLLPVCWYAAGGTQAGAGQGLSLSDGFRLAALRLAEVAGVAALCAVAVLALTGFLARRLPVPERLPQAVGWTGTAASGAMAAAALLLTASLVLAASWTAPVAAALAAVTHAVVAPSARACRRCARLTPAT
ncbi:permease prefix domain 1-containing protein [Streptomyces sp. DSM 42041]|uniref:Permease prefix domain 1-containing protein n=1 Tax=Streptomyces hazeniae TaxID=3075538 RepID=A0ABU2NXD9_9ACTN|nr:permease prefix domain 1-containing protein [Streptomyces sp. DSM 42041]MDT0381172.1 permease prefix domain 1-containing protein [Streptomyces sp. DSM 42041]